MFTSHADYGLWRGHYSHHRGHNHGLTLSYRSECGRIPTLLQGNHQG